MSSPRRRVRRLYERLLAVVSDALVEAWKALEWWELAVSELQEAWKELGTLMSDPVVTELLGARRERDFVVVKTPWGAIAWAGILFVKGKTTARRLRIPPRCLLERERWGDWRALETSDYCYPVSTLLKVFEHLLNRLGVEIPSEVEVEVEPSSGGPLSSEDVAKDIDYSRYYSGKTPEEWVDAASAVLEHAGREVAQLILAYRACGGERASLIARRLINYVLREYGSSKWWVREPLYQFLSGFCEVVPLIGIECPELPPPLPVPSPSLPLPPFEPDSLGWPEALEALETALRMARRVRRLVYRLAPRTEQLARGCAKRARAAKSMAELLKLLLVE